MLRGSGGWLVGCVRMIDEHILAYVHEGWVLWEIR